MGPQRRAAWHGPPAGALGGANRPRRQGIRRQAGALIAVGPLIGFAAVPALGEHTLVIVVGAVALALVGVWADRRTAEDRQVALTVAGAAAFAVALGVRFEPTGVGALDVLGAFVLIALVTAAVDGLGDADALPAGIGVAGALGVVALAGFAHQDSLAAVAAGFGAACLAFLAFNLPPASLFVGRGGRLAIGYVLAVGALSVRLPVDPARRLLVPLMLLGLLLLDAVVVIFGRLRRQRPLLEPRADHLVHRLVAYHWPTSWAVAVLVGAEVLLSTVAIFTGRDVLSFWVGLALLAVVLAVIGNEAARGTVDRRQSRGFSRRARVVTGVVATGLVVTVLPVVLAAPDVRDEMDRGRAATERALSAAREGDHAAAALGFRRAVAAFDKAHEKLNAPTLSGGLLVPGLAPNLRAARTLAAVGRDLAHAGNGVTSVVDPESLQVIGGRLPLDEVRRVTPALESGARTLDRALATLRSLDDPYLLPVVSDTLQRIERQMARSTGEARRGVTAAKLAPAVFGGDSPRTYLLVVQNNAELRATGGLIGNWGLLHAVDGKVSVDRLQRTSLWNERLRALANPTIDAPPDYHERYDLQQPERGLQSVNLSPDFPTVARVLTSLAPQVGVGEIDGVMAVDPLGLAALLELTGPVQVEDWPEPVSAANVVDVTLRDAYATFAETPERAEFLGDVAQVVVDEATEGSLGVPARVAKVLGRAAHENHVMLAFTRPAEQRLARELGVSGEIASLRSDALAVNTQNAGANKIDYYLRRRIDYRVHLDPDAGGRAANVTARVRIRLDNTAPDQGLPQIVIGPYAPGFAAGVNRSWVSVYTPLAVRSATVDGRPTPFFGAIESGRTVESVFVDIPARSSRTVALTLAGRVPLDADGWYDLDLGHQPTLEPDKVHVSVEVASGWQIAASPNLVRPFDRRAVGRVELDQPERVRVHAVPRPASLDLWGRLVEGT